MPTKGVPSNLLKRHSFNLCGGPKETAVHHFLGQAHRLKNLRAPITRKRADAHLGHDFQQPILDGLPEIRHRLVQLYIKIAGLNILANGVNRHVRVHRRRTIANEGRKLVHIMCLATLTNHVSLHAQAFADKVMMHGPHRQQHRDGHVIPIRLTIGQDQNALSFPNGRGGLFADARQRLIQPDWTLRFLEMTGDKLTLKCRITNIFQRLQLVLKQERALQQDLLGVRLAFLQPTALGAHVDVQRHHDTFADAVNWWIGHLREELLEVVMQQLGLAGQCRQGRVITHGAHRLHAAHHHRLQNFVNLLALPTTGDLPQREVKDVHRGGIFTKGLGMILQREELVITPVRIGLQARGMRLAIRVLINFPGCRINGNKFTRPQATLTHHLALRQINYANLAPHHHQAILVHLVAGGPQTVSIKRRSNCSPVGKHDRRGTIPRLIEAGMEFIESLQFTGEILLFLPSLRGQHHGTVNVIPPRKLQ